MMGAAEELAVAEVRAKHMTFSRNGVSLTLQAGDDGEPVIARVDRDVPDGPVIVYFAIENRSYFLAAFVNERPSPAITGIHLEPGVEVAFQVFSQTHPLAALRAVTTLVPTSTWDDMPNGRTSGLAIQPGWSMADSTDDSVNRMLDLLDTDPEGVVRLAALADAFIEVDWYGAAHMPQFPLRAGTLERLARLHIELRVSIAITG